MLAFVLEMALLATASAIAAPAPEQPLFPPLTISAPLSRDRTCGEHSRQLEAALANRTLWAMHMMDASATGSSTSGALSGSVYQLGDFDQCLAAAAPWPAQYCLATIRYQVPHTGALPLHHQVYASNGTVWDKVHYSGAEHHLPLDELTWGLCVPASCSEEEMQSSLETHLSGVASSLHPASALNVTVQHCTARLERDYRADSLDVIFVLVVGLLLLLLALGTLLDVLGDSRKQSRRGKDPPPEECSCCGQLGGRLRPVLECFSVRRSLRALGAPEPRPGGLPMEPVSGVRFLNMLLLVCVHRVLNVFRGPVHNYLDVADAVEDIPLTGVIHGQLFVDTCFYLAGMLLGMYELTRPRQSAQSFGRSLLLRYIRLTPTYAVIILFYASVFYKMGSGPLWDSFIAVERDACRQHWWANLLYINNYVPTDTLCMFQSWSLAADLHYFVMGSLLMMLVRRSYRWGVTVLLFLGVVSVALPFSLTVLQRWPAMLMFTPSFLKDINHSPMFRLVYSASHNRASPYLIGIGAALILHQLHKRNYRFSTRGTWILEAIAPSLMLPVLLTSVVFYNPEHAYSATEAAAYASLTPVCWTAGLLAGSLSSMLGTRSIVRLSSASRPFVMLSKLTYCVYLVHWIYQMSSTATLRAPYHQSDFKTMQEAASDIVNSFALALVLHLAVEAPTRTLSKLLLSPSRAKQHQQYSMTASTEVGFGRSKNDVQRVSSDPNGNVLKTDQ